MIPLATLGDVESRLGRELTGDEPERMFALLEDASARFRLESTQTFTVVEDDVATLPIAGSRVLLPQRPVTAVTAVTDASANAVVYAWLGTDYLTLTNTNDHPFWTFAFEPLNVPRESVIVTYDHGGDVPPVVIATVCAMATRAFGTNPLTSGITQESIDGYSYSVGSAAAAGGAGMLATELEVAHSFRRLNPPVSEYAT